MGIQKGASCVVTIVTVTPVRNLVRIQLDSGAEYWLRKQDMYALSCQEGNEVDEEVFLQQVRLLQYPRALNHAVSMLARRPCSRHEVFSSLQRHRYTEEIAALVVYKLEKENLLNDESFCEQWIRYRQDCRFGKKRILLELRQKGIPEDLARSALENTEDPDNSSGAFSLALRAWNRTKPEEDIRKSRQKVIACLVRKGYDWETARSACDAAEKQKSTAH